MSWYDRIQQVAVGGGGRARLGAGDYVLHVQLVKEHPGGQGGNYFTIEFIVLQSTNPQCPPGLQAGETIRTDGKYPDSALQDVKAFAAAAVGLEPTDPRAQNEIGPPVIAGILHPSQPVAGHVLHANVWMKPNKDPAKEPYAKYRWRPMLDESGAPVRKPVERPVAQPQAAPAGYGAPPNVGAPAYGQPPAQQAPDALARFAAGLPGQTAPAQAPGGFPGFPNPAQPALGGFPAPTLGPQPPQAPPQDAAGAYGAPGMAPAQAQFPAPTAAPGPWTPPGATPPAQAPPAATWPPTGWAPHPQAPGHFWKGQTVLSEADLRTLAATGQA